MAVDDGDPAGLDQAREALVQPGDDPSLYALTPRGRRPRTSRGCRTVRVPRRVRHLAGVQQRLGRDAAAVQAGPADLVLLDTADAQPELGRA